MADATVLQPKPTDVFVSPLIRISPEDVNSAIHELDAWLRRISGGWVTVERLKTVAQNVPVLANIFAAVDAVMDIRAMIEHGDKPVDAFDWLNLGLDLIGIVPVPLGTAELRMGARPLLKLIRQKAAENGKALLEGGAQVLGTAVIDGLVAHLNERYAGEIESFLALVKGKLNEMLEHGATLIGELMTALADLFERAAGEKGFSIAGNIHAAERHASEVSAGFAAYDAKQAMHGIGGLIVDWVKINGKETLNAATETAKFINSDYGHDLKVMSADLRKRIPEVKQRVRSLSGNEIGQIGWLIQIGEDGVARWRQKNPKHHVLGIPSSGKTKVVEQRAEGALDELEKTAPAKHPGAEHCKLRCPVASPAQESGRSVGFALGDEKIEHVDFSIAGPMPIVWQRTYRSFFDANDDEGPLGARWITPYTTRFDIEESKLVYHDAAGRSVDYPLLAVGRSYDNLAADLTITRLDEGTLALNRGHELLELFEKAGDRFRLRLIRDRKGNQIIVDYDDKGRLFRLMLPATQVAFKYDDRSRIVEAGQYDANGDLVAKLARYTYDAENDLVLAADRYGNKWQYQYSHHLVTRYTDRTGRGTNLQWDGTHAKAKCVREWLDDGSDEIRLAWHPDFRRVDVTDGLGQRTQHYYDIKGYSFRIVHPDGSEEWMYRDQNDNLTQYIHRDGGVERMAYDGRGNLIRHHRVDGSVVEMAYDAKEQMIALTDPHGNVWHQEYDDKGNLTAQIDPLGHKTEYGYNEQGLVTSVKDAKGGVKQLAYDGSGQVTRYTDCSGKTTKWTYDADGRLTATIDAAGNATTYRYGENGQLAQVQSPAGIEQIHYDAEGRLRGHTDPLGRNTRYQYDAAGRIANRVDALDQTIAYRYDRLGRLTTLVDANQATYSFAYDPVGRLLEEVAFDGKRTRYTYDEANGRLTSIDEAGQITQVEYDRGGRLSKRTSGASEERFAYDQSGRLIDAQNRYSHIQRFFDPVGNLVREHHAYRLFDQAKSYVWHHRYDELGNRIQTIRPDGHAIDWLTYGSGHVHGMLLDGEERIQFERDDLHRETRRTLGSRLGLRTVYDPAGRVIQTALQREKAPMPIVDRRYRYDAAGQLTQIEDSAKGYIDYRYDPVGRLVEAASPWSRERFAFDPASNIVDVPADTQERAPRMMQAVYRPREESTLPEQVPKILGNLLKQYAGMHFAYDERGNLISRRTPAGEQKYEWDAFNRLMTAMIKEGERRTSASYFYDALGRRIAKSVNGERTLFGWDGDTLAYESTEHGSTHYVYEAGSFVPLAQFVTNTPVQGIDTPVWKPTDRYLPEEDPLQRVAQAASPAHVFYYHCDHIGTPYMMTDDLGDVVWEATYRAWGETQDVIARVSQAVGIAARNPIRFQGQQHDAETGLSYNRHRYYDPAMGRFVSMDPIGLHGGLNSYQYAPNPVQWIDPFGLAKKPPSQFALQDGDGATPTEMTASRIGGGSRAGQEACRQRLLAASTTGVYKCWRCGHTSTNPSDMHLGHRNVPTSKGGNLSNANIDLEGASCNLSAGNSGYVKEGMSCVERGSCGAPYGR
ncbi:sugar-binding protein [Paraburkholderia sp. T12-10]|nr:sugar-binding protein [Paraburkholderia sp. T12-10]